MAELESHPSRSPGTSPTRAGNFRTPTLTESPAGLRAWLGAEGHPLLFAEDKCAFTRISLGVSGLTRSRGCLWDGLLGFTVKTSKE